MTSARRTLLGACICAALLSCDDDGPVALEIIDTEVIAVGELTFQNIGQPEMHATVTVARSLDELEQARTNGISTTDTIAFEAFSVGVLDQPQAGGHSRRYIHARFRVWNAFLPGLPSQQRVTLVAIASAHTWRGTPYRTLATADSAPISAELVAQVQASGLARFSQDGVLTVDSVDVLRLLSPDETRQIRTDGVTRIFNFGHIVTCAAPISADGVTLVAWSLPLYETRTRNLTTLSVLILALRQTL